MNEISVKDLGIKVAAGAADTAPDSAEVATWLRELDAAKEREKAFRKEGNRINQIYEGALAEATPFNILYSNTETMQPALYNSTPQPVVQRRFKDEDPMGALASKAAERTLKYLIDDGNGEYTSFDDLMKSATLEALLPGRGVTRFKYDALIEAAENVAAAGAVEADESSEDSETDAADGESEAPQETLRYETVCGEEVPWDRFLHGSAKKWKDVPWIAFEHFMVREELEKNFGEVGARVPVTELIRDNGNAYQDSSENKTSATGTEGVKVAQVYEVWDKDSRHVLFIAPAWKAAPLKKVADELKLTGFYPCPKPLQFVSKISTLTPVPLYKLYEEQAKELNRITIRINKIISALKVRGMYDATVEGIGKVLEADDNVLVAAENVAAMLSQGNSLEKAIWLMPIEKLVAVLQQLYVQREQVKTIIYELTGVADIMRGSSAASETLGAQKLKNQWGTLRLKKAQKEVMRYARDCLRIIAEIAVTRLSQETLRAMTGLPYPTGAEKVQATQQLQLMQASGQPQPDPKLLQVAQSPSWEEILTLLRDDTQRNYRIDIETNSTVDAEATEDRESIAELLTAISQFLHGVGPLVENGTMPFEVAQGMLLAVVRRFRFGPELEDLLKKMTAPKQENPEELKKQSAEIAKATQELETQKAAIGEQQQQAVQAVKAQQQSSEQEIAKQLQEIELQKQEVLHTIALERKTFEQDKALALQEIQFEAKAAERETEFALKLKEAEADQRIRTKEHNLQLKQAAFAETQSRARAAAVPPQQSLI